MPTRLFGIGYGCRPETGFRKYQTPQACFQLDTSRSYSPFPFQFGTGTIQSPSRCLYQYQEKVKEWKQVAIVAICIIILFYRQVSTVLGFFFKVILV